MQPSSLRHGQGNGFVMMMNDVGHSLWHEVPNASRIHFSFASLPSSRASCQSRIDFLRTRSTTS